MSKHEHPNLDDLLEKAVAAFRSQQIPTGPSPRIFTDTLLTLRGAGKSINFWQRVIVMIQSHKIAASIIVILSGVAISVAAILFGGFPSISYAQVAEQLRSIQSMSCTVTSQATIKSKPISTRDMFMSPGKMRKEISNGIILILDVQSQRSILLDQQKKTVTIIKVPTSQPADPATDLIETFKNLANSKANPVADRNISGINTKGFHTQQGGVNVTIYVDPKSNLPVELDYDPSEGGVGTKYTDFDFNAKLDPSLFSLDPPVGYAVNVMGVPSSDLGENLLPMLRAYTQKKKGQFPPKLDDTSDIFHTLLKRVNAGKPDPAQQKVMNSIFMSQGLLVQYHKGKDWDYFPEGAKLGDKNKIILWYQPQGLTTYKAVYADLRIADVTIDQLPTLPPPPGGF
jgi:outer membrane lipoprotein-sorting protein